MQPSALDHLNVQIPEDRVDDAVAFYEGVLGCPVEDLDAYRRGERPIFSFRINPTAILHVSPVEPSSFSVPDRDSYNHFALVFENDIGEIRAGVEEADVTIRRSSKPLGATGRNPAIYVEDPFGYVVELKAAQ